MKIVIAVHHFPPDYAGGAELRAHRTAAWLRDHGHQVYVVCVKSIESGETGLTFEDTMYDELPVRRLRFDRESTPDPFRWSYDNPWIGEHLGGYLQHLAPDVLHLFSGYLMSGSTLQAAGRLGIPTVVSLTDFWFLCPRITLLRSNGECCGPPFSALTCACCLGEEKRRYRWLWRVASRLMDAYWSRQSQRIREIGQRMEFLQRTLQGVGVMISPSRFLRQVYVDAGIEPDSIVFSRQGRDFPDLKPADLAKTPSRGLRIGYMGQIAPHKGVHTLIEAVRLLPKASLMLTIYGDLTKFPLYVGQLRRMAGRDGRIVLAGAYQRVQISQVMKDIDVVVVPSTWYENSPNTILEAFAHRTPVVAANLGGMAELVEDGVNGWLFEPGDASDLARKLDHFVRDRESLSRFGQGCRPPKSVDQEMTELLGIYVEAVSGNSSLRREGERSR